MQQKENYYVLLYGDSISRGIIYDEANEKYSLTQSSFAHLVGRRLKGKLVNASKFGNTILRAARRLTKDVQKNEPDIVVLEFGGNDCNFNWEEVAENPYKDHQPATDFALFQKNLKNTIEYLSTNHVIPVLMTIPPIDADRYFKWISKNDPGTAEKILVWLDSVSKIYWWQERYNSAILTIARETKTRLIDIRSAFLKKPDYRLFYCKDGIHPNAQGQKLIADKIIEYISNGYSFLLKDP